MKRRFAAVLAASIFATPALACEEFFEVDRSEAKELVAVLKDAQADELDQVFAIEGLICAKRPALRDYAIRAGLAAQSPSVRAQTLKQVIFTLNQIVIRFLPEEGLTRAQADFIRKTPTHPWPVTNRDPQRNCISLYQKHCGEWALQVVSTLVHLRYKEWRGRFELEPSGTLRGLYWNTKWEKDMKPLPAEIELR